MKMKRMNRLADNASPPRLQGWGACELECYQPSQSLPRYLHLQRLISLCDPGKERLPARLRMILFPHAGLQRIIIMSPSKNTSSQVARMMVYRSRQKRANSKRCGTRSWKTSTTMEVLRRKRMWQHPLLHLHPAQPAHLYQPLAHPSHWHYNPDEADPLAQSRRSHVLRYANP